MVIASQWCILPIKFIWLPISGCPVCANRPTAVTPLMWSPFAIKRIATRSPQFPRALYASLSGAPKDCCKCSADRPDSSLEQHQSWAAQKQLKESLKLWRAQKFRVQTGHLCRSSPSPGNDHRTQIFCESHDHYFWLILQLICCSWSVPPDRQLLLSKQCGMCASNKDADQMSYRANESQKCSGDWGLDSRIAARGIRDSEMKMVKKCLESLLITLEWLSMEWPLEWEMAM